MVDSSRPGVKPWLVDLEENNAVGQCNCERFYYNIQPRINEGKHVTACKHIRAAREHLLDRIIREATANARRQ